MKSKQVVTDEIINEEKDEEFSQAGEDTVSTIVFLQDEIRLKFS